MDYPVYLITYNDLGITEFEAQSIVGDGYHTVDAVAALAGGEEMKENVIYHFNGMGISALIATPEPVATKVDYSAGGLGETPVMTLLERSSVHNEPLFERVSGHPHVSSVCEWKSGDNAHPARPGNESLDNRFAYVSPDRTEWNLDFINATGATAREFNGKGIKIAILDTGIAPHTDLNVRGGVSFCEWGSDFRHDPHGHGTHCAGIAAGRLGGIANEADLFSIKVCNESEGASPIAILAGLGWALRNRMNVVSISFAGSAELRYVPAFANAVQALMRVNCLVVASTGESGGAVAYPANTPGIVAVGGCDYDGLVLNGTGIGGNGNRLTVVAPATGITTTYHAHNAYIRTFGGCSAAAPHVAGLIALIQQKFTGIPPLQVIGRILASAQPASIAVNNTNVRGLVPLIDCDKALSSL